MFARARSLADDDVQREIFHRRVEHFFHGAAQAMHFVDEEDVALAQIGEDGRQVAGALDGRARRDLEPRAHLHAQDMREGGLAEARRSIEQDVIQRLAASRAARIKMLRFSRSRSWPSISDSERGRSAASTTTSSGRPWGEIVRSDIESCDWQIDKSANRQAALADSENYTKSGEIREMGSKQRCQSSILEMLALSSG